MRLPRSPAARAILPAACGLVAAVLVSVASLAGGAQAHRGPGPGPDLVGGTLTGYERWRGVVNLYNRGPGCTGVFIDPEVVLASGHCTTGFITV